MVTATDITTEASTQNSKKRELLYVEGVEDFSFLRREEADYFYQPARYRDTLKRGVDTAVVDCISRAEGDPPWLRELRFAALEAFERLDMPGKWAPEELGGLDLGSLNTYRPLASAGTDGTDDWESVPEEVRETLERLDLRSEQETFLGGLSAQFDSSIAFKTLDEELRKKGIVFTGSVSGLRDYPDLFREAFGSLVPYDSNKLTALNTALFSGGAFLYVPPGVKVGLPLKSYFRINEAGCGQFGRTLIILGEEAELTFMEGCSAPDHSTDSLHAAVGEVIVRRGAKLQYVTFQNWSRQVYNLVQMRSLAEEGAQVKWLDCNIGGKLTMKYPSTILHGAKARSEIISIGFATTGQRQDTGGKMLHRASDTRSSIISKSISLGEGRASYRGKIDIGSSVDGCLNHTECDALLVNADSRTDTYPAITVSGDANAVQHEASVSRISEEQIFYLRQRGLTKEQAVSLAVNGFINDLVREFPIEYSAPLRRLIDLEMEGSVG